MSAITIKSYTVWPLGFRDLAITMNATSLGRAKAHLLRQARDAGYTFDHTSIVGTCAGAPTTSKEFEACAQYRGVPFARCGMRVRLFNGNEGLIIGHTSSACFKVFFTSGDYKGVVLSCHPNTELSYLDEQGSIIKQFT